MILRLGSEVEAILRPLGKLDARELTTRVVGGKALGLSKLAMAGARIPPTWILPATVFRDFVRSLPEAFSFTQASRSPSDPRTIEHCARMRELLLRTDLPKPIGEALSAWAAQLAPTSPWGFAVRSSATCEDGRERSMAGIATSLLGVRDAAALDRAVREVFASLFLPGAMVYIAQGQIRDPAMAVVLQPTIRADAAGVLFSRAPGSRKGPVVSAGFGLGTEVVSGAVTGDLFTWDEKRESWQTTVADKRAALVVQNHQITQRPIPLGLRFAPSLDATSLALLREEALALEHKLGHAVDLEFAVELQDGGPQVVWLQAREILEAPLPEGGEEDTLWSRLNLSEALPDAATPLTWSVAKAFSERGFRDAFRALGCVPSRGVVFATEVDGRIYLNLTQICRTLAQAPGFSPRLVAPMAGQLSEEHLGLLERQVERISHRSFALRAPVALPRLVADKARLHAKVERFGEEFQARVERMRSLDLGLLPDDGLATSLKQVSGLMHEAGSLMLEAASTSLLAFVVLRAAVARWVPAKMVDTHLDDGFSVPEAQTLEPTSIAHALTAGAGQIESAQPGLWLLKMAAMAKEEPAFMAALERGAPFSELPPGPTQDQFRLFLERFGTRASREAELSVPRWHEVPDVPLAMLRSLASSPVEQELEARVRAAADAELARLEDKLPAYQFIILRGLVSVVRSLARLREQTRSWVTTALDGIRRVALEIDVRIRGIDPSLESGSVFFGTIEELTSALRSGHPDLGHILRLRRAQWLRDSAKHPPKISFVGNPSGSYESPENDAAAQIQGLGVSPGVAEARVRTVRTASDAFDLEFGEVLVVESVDVAMTPYFLTASAIVTELGGPLSHAAIVAREYGVPYVASAPLVTTRLRTGDHVRVDGSRGTVQILEHTPPSIRPKSFQL